MSRKKVQPELNTCKTMKQNVHQTLLFISGAKNLGVIFAGVTKMAPKNFAPEVGKNGRCYITMLKIAFHAILNHEMCRIISPACLFLYSHQLQL